MESRNPTIVKILEEKGSVIENRHSGIPTMKREMKKYGLPEPEFLEERDSFKVIFRNNSAFVGTQIGAQIGAQAGVQTGIENTIDNAKQKVLDYCEIPRSSKEIRNYIGLSSKTYVAERVIKPLLKLGLIEYTNKKSINARNQKYVTIKK